VTPPVPVHHPSARYTKEARQAGISGTVYVNVVINDKGEVTDARVSGGWDMAWTKARCVP
jgi:outer membrane biosynthesis protein TonB